jgi:putative tryptophan/tyrosine transport system permease protein
MPTAIFGSLEAGALYALMALGVYLSFRILDFPDLTVDGSFVTGGAVAAILIVNGTDPFLATAAAIVAGFIAGCFTGLLHTKGKINALLSGILMMIALYSINLRIMGKSNISMLSEDTVITKLTGFWKGLGIDDAFQGALSAIGIGGFVPKTWGILFLMIILAFVVKAGIDWFLKTELGLALRATGDNETMVKSFSVDTDFYKIVGLGLSNALVAFSGALVAQYNGFSDVGMGIGMIVIGLASVIIGEAVFGAKSIIRATAAVIGGAILYRLIVTMALRVEFLETGDMKLITALIVICALVLPKFIERQKEKQRKRKRLKLMQEQNIHSGTDEGGQSLATAKSDF